MTDDYLWDPTAAPDPEIARLEALLRPLAYKPEPLRVDTVAPPTAHIRYRRWLAAAAALIIVSAGVIMARQTPTVAPWQVAVRHGAPVVRTADGDLSRGALTSGGAVETDARSSARLSVGRIGTVDLAPGSRLRLLDAGASEHRLSLERGSMHAIIDAPPRYFLVETASALAVDLGCVYTLSVDERGNGMLVVEEGEVELERGDVRAAVLAGNSAAIRAGKGPGLPYPTSASVSLQRAVAAYDADPAGVGALDAVLAATDRRSTITLWHLLRRETPAARVRVYERLASLAPPPASVARDRVLRGESGALQRWRTELQPEWITEPPRWKHLLNNLRRMW
ncbi:MAG: hypothetical protein ACJ8AD_06550 [Gemmatimonadaceae bacterium]